MVLAIFLSRLCIPSNLSVPSRFLVRPQLLTRGQPLPVGRDISQITSTPLRISCLDRQAVAAFER